MTATSSPRALAVLIVKLGAIGDVAMALPMISALQCNHPRCRIAWLCGESARALLDCVGGVDELIVADDRALLAGSRREKVTATLAVWRRLAGRRFDLVLTAHSDRRYGLPHPVGARRVRAGRWPLLPASAGSSPGAITATNTCGW